MATFTLRLLDTAKDYERVAQIRNEEDSNQVSLETLLEWDRNWPEDGVRRRMVAVDSERQIAGYSMSFRRPADPPGRYEMRVIVDRQHRNRGVGSQLYSDADAFLLGQGARRIDALVKENCTQCLSFAEKRGFRQHRHLFESVLEIDRFDPEPYRELTPGQNSGIRFFSFADTDGSVAEQRRLWNLNVETAQDVPGTDTVVRDSWPFEQFQKDVFQARWFNPDGQILAEENGRLIGICAVGEFEPGQFSNTHTGVLKEFRGRGIALALKLLAIECARRNGGKTLRTNNDSDNAAMIHINQKLGYRPEPGWYLLKKELNGQEIV